MLDEPVSSAPSSGSSPRHAISPVSRLVVEREVDRGLDHRPLRSQVGRVAGREVVVPRAGCHVTRHVRVECRVLDVVADVVRVPAPVGALLAREPLVRGARLLVPAAEVERHGRLDEVPRVGVAARHPRDVAVGDLLRARSRSHRRRRAAARRHDPGDVGQLAHAAGRLLGVHDEALAEDGVERPVEGVEPRRLRRDLPHEEVVVLAHRPRVGVVHADRALEPPVRRVQRVRVVRSAEREPRGHELGLEVALPVDAEWPPGVSW